MTKKQRREQKQANQERKAEILKLAKDGPEETRWYWATAGVCQNGKYTKK